MGNYSILDELKITVNITNNPYHFAESDLFEMAMRINKNRSFLFVSKVLGKHLALKPQLPLLMGQLLAMEYMHTVHGIQDTRAESIAQAITNGDDLQDLLEKLEKAPIYIEEPTKIIGFAETATALGHAFFSAFSGDVSYIHTTREKLVDREPIIAFEEEHSHATSHRVYAQSEAFFEGSSEMIIIMQRHFIVMPLQCMILHRIITRISLHSSKNLNHSASRSQLQKPRRRMLPILQKIRRHLIRNHYSENKIGHPECRMSVL